MLQFQCRHCGKCLLMRFGLRQPSKCVSMTIDETGVHVLSLRAQPTYRIQEKVPVGDQTSDLRPDKCLTHPGQRFGT